MSEKSPWVQSGFDINELTKKPKKEKGDPYKKDKYGKKTK